MLFSHQRTLLVSSLAVVLLLAGCSSPVPDVKDATQQPPRSTAGPVLVQVAEVKRSELANGLSYSGNVQARQQVTLVPKMGGRVVRLHVDVGSTVKAGDVLVELDRDAAEAQVAQAEAGLAAAQAKLAGLEAGSRSEQVAQAAANLRAAQARLTAMQAGGRKETVAQVEANLKAAEARLAQAKAGPTPEQLAIAEAQVRLARNQEYLTQQQDEELFRRTNEGTSHSNQVPVYSAPMGNAMRGVAWEQTKIAEANLAQLKAGPTPELLVQLEMAVEALRQQLALAQSPYTEQDLAQVEVAVEVASQQLALARHPVTEHDLNAAKAAVAQARAAANLAKVQLAESTIRAPFAGIVTQRLVSEGAMAGPTSPLMTMISSDSEISINVDEAVAASLKEDDQAQVVASAFPGRQVLATVRTIAPTVDARTHMVQVRLSPLGSTGELRDGTFVQVQLAGTATRKEALTVPRVAVLSEGGFTVVYQVESGRAQRRVVTTGNADGDLVGIVEGLREGDRVVISGLSSLKDGQAVTVQ